MKLKTLIVLSLTSFWSMSFAGIDEEALLRREAALVAQKVHMKNLNLIGVNPKTCKSTDSDKLIIKQIKEIKNSSLNHCPSVVENVLKPLNDEIAKVHSGVLVYAPLPKTAVPLNSIPTMDEPVFNDSSQELRSGELPLQESLTQDFDPEAPVGTTGLTVSDVDRIFESYESNQRMYRPSEEDNLFKILSKAYIRNLNRLIQRKREF